MSGKQTLVTVKHTADSESVRCDIVRSKFFAVPAASNLDDTYHSLQSSIQLDVTLHDDRIGQERHAMRAQAKIDKAILYFRRH